MSDGHTDAARASKFYKEPLLRDVSGREVYEDDLIWYAADDGSLIKANVLEVTDYSVTVMTKTSQLVELMFTSTGKHIPTCNFVLKA